MRPDHTKKKEVTEPNTYLLRWNPATSNMTIDRYREILSENPEGYCSDWSIHDYADAKEGDLFYMLREGNPNGGIIFRGVFTSNPYEDYDWRGTGKKRHYINFLCYSPVSADEQPPLDLSLLSDVLPEINWEKGHSGELLTKQQACALALLWNETHPECNEFDKDAGHGDHLSCFDENIESIVSDLQRIISKSAPIAASPEIDVVTDTPQKVQLVCMSTCTKDIAIRSTLLCQDDSMEIVAFIPYAVNDNATKFKLTDIQEYSNGFEAILTVEYGDTSFSFFDIDYPLHKNHYKIGEQYSFALSALAYHAEFIPEEESSLVLTEEGIVQKKSHEPDDCDNPSSIVFSECICYLQIDDSYPEDAIIQSSVMSKTRKATCLGRQFYRTEICLYPESEDAATLNIPLITKMSDFDRKPLMKDVITASIWLQGRLID